MFFTIKLLLLLILTFSEIFVIHRTKLAFLFHFFGLPTRDCLTEI